MTTVSCRAAVAASERPEAVLSGAAVLSGLPPLRDKSGHSAEFPGSLLPIHLPCL